MKWKRVRIVDSPSIYKNRPTIYRDIKFGSKVIAERVLFTEAEKLIQALNQR